MKKIFLILVAVIGLGISANAQSVLPFRKDQVLCATNEDSQKERLILFKDLTFKGYIRDVLVSTGVYKISDNRITLKGKSVKNINDEVEILLTKVVVQSGNIQVAFFNKIPYMPCD